jgi:hypothetical protein
MGIKYINICQSPQDMDRYTRERVAAAPAAYLEIYSDERRNNAWFGRLHIGHFGGFSNRNIFWTKVSYDITLNCSGHNKALAKAREMMSFKAPQIKRMLEGITRYNKVVGYSDRYCLRLLNQIYPAEFLAGIEILPEPPVSDLEVAVEHYLDDRWWAVNSF